MRIGWVGLGAMGGPMAACAARAGFDVAGFDRDEAACSALAAAGGRVVASSVEAAIGSDVLVLMVATPAQVEDVLFGSDGVAAAMQVGGIVMIMATVGEDAVDSWALRLRESGVGFVDAPVSGGIVRAASGELLVMPSGRSEEVAVVQPLLDVLAATAPHVGERVGDGQRLKLVNQLLCGVHIAAAAEALAFAEMLGLDANATWKILRTGAAQSFMFDDRGGRMLDSDPSVRSAVDIFVKDMGLVVDAARRTDLDPVLGAAAQSVFTAAADAGLGRRDDSSVIETYRR